MERRLLYSVDLLEYPTHVRKTKNKVKADTYIKVNNQNIYNQSIHFSVRSLMINQLHDYIKEYLPIVNTNLEYPVTISYKFYTPINYASVSRRYDKKIRNYIISWNPASDDYVPSNDLDNMSTLWVKTIQDVLTHQGYLLDDNLKYIKRYEVEFIEISDLKDRKIKLEIFKY